MKPGLAPYKQSDVASAVLLNFPLWETWDDILNGRKRGDTAAGKALARGKGPPVLRSTAFEGNSLGAVPAVIDHAESLVAGLTRGLSDLPSGPKRALECDVRRAEVLEGIGQILNVMDATEQAIGKEAEPLEISDSERECYAGRLRWAAGMTKGLRQGVAHLLWYDTYNVPGDMYSTINSFLGECEARVSRLSQSLEELEPGEQEPFGAGAAPAAGAGASGVGRRPDAAAAAAKELATEGADGDSSPAAGAESVTEMTRALKEAREEVSAMMASAYSTIGRAEEPPAPPPQRSRSAADDPCGSGRADRAASVQESPVRRESGPPLHKDAALGQESRSSEYDDWMNDFMAKYVQRALIGVSELFSPETEDIERLFKPNQLPTMVAAEQAAPATRQVETY
uniref:Uncharacterized protein n=1 Tax=Alexandrium monilatum TaxID=311494 RepID=A0A7S4V719_9DINO